MRLVLIHSRSRVTYENSATHYDGQFHPRFHSESPLQCHHKDNTPNTISLTHDYSVSLPLSISVFHSLTHASIQSCSNMEVFHFSFPPLLPSHYVCTWPSAWILSLWSLHHPFVPSPAATAQVSADIGEQEHSRES